MKRFMKDKDNLEMLLIDAAVIFVGMPVSIYFRASTTAIMLVIAGLILINYCVFSVYAKPEFESTEKYKKMCFYAILLLYTGVVVIGFTI